jgi:TolA-binding protein
MPVTTITSIDISENTNNQEIRDLKIIIEKLQFQLEQQNQKNEKKFEELEKRTPLKIESLSDEESIESSQKKFKFDKSTEENNIMFSIELHNNNSSYINWKETTDFINNGFNKTFTPKQLKRKYNYYLEKKKNKT